MAGRSSKGRRNHDDQMPPPAMSSGATLSGGEGAAVGAYQPGDPEVPG